MLWVLLVRGVLASVGAGRNDVVILSAPVPIVPWQTVGAQHLVERLSRRKYVRVHARPTEPGSYFLGTERVWIYRRSYRNNGVSVPAQLVQLDRTPLGLGIPRTTQGVSVALSLEPVELARSWRGDAGPRADFRIDGIPPHVWQPVLALEDTRFFEHPGVDPRGLLRAAWANFRAGSVVEGGSTVTQQLVKNRDLSSRRGLDRKLSEALRAVALDLQHDKMEILEAYLQDAYYGHVDGVAVVGLPAAARVWFDTTPAKLSIAQAALLAAMLQGPNGMAPDRHPERAQRRRDRALSRMAELGWASAEDVATAKHTPITLHKTPPTPAVAQSFVRAVGDWVTKHHGERGAWVQTTLDPAVQAAAERAASTRPKGTDLSLLAVDNRTGEVLAWVGDPTAHRQPGSTVKPFVMLYALQCGLHAATRVSDAPFTLNRWSPHNSDHKSHGSVLLGEALVHSYNRPFVQVTEQCGRHGLAQLFHRAGLPAGEEPASLPLGTVELSPLALAGAWTGLHGGRVHPAIFVRSVQRPNGGRWLKAQHSPTVKLARPGDAAVVHSLLVDVVERGTGKRAKIPGHVVSGKTGTTKADAWFVGSSGTVTVVVWVGHREGGTLNKYGGAVAAPVAQVFLAEAVNMRVARDAPRVARIKVSRATGRRAAEGVVLPFSRRHPPATWPWSEPTEVIRAIEP